MVWIDPSLTPDKQTFIIINQLIDNVELIKNLNKLLEKVLITDHAIHYNRKLSPTIEELQKYLYNIKLTLTESQIYKKEYEQLIFKINLFINALNEFIDHLDNYTQLQDNLKKFIIILNRTVKVITNYKDTDFVQTHLLK